MNAEQPTKLEILAKELEMEPQEIREVALELRYRRIGFRPGDKVKINPESEFSYEVARLEKFPHGWMVGIYDEPPGKHVDFWNPSSLYLA